MSEITWPMVSDDPAPPERTNPVNGEMIEYAFDVVLFAAIRVKACSEADARKQLREALDAADSNFGAWRDGSPITGEASMDGEPTLYEVNGESV